MNKMTKQQSNIADLFTLIKENPELEIVPMVHYEVCGGDEFSTWMGGWGKAEIDEVYHVDERIYFKSTDQDQVGEEIFDDLETENPAWSREYILEQTEIKEKEVPWQKVIAVNITLP